MKVKFIILYSWFIRSVTFFLPEVPLIQAFRGWLYSFGMKKCGPRFRVSYNVVINHLEEIEVGRNVYLACGSVVTGGGKLFIGDDVLIGPNVILSSNKHKFNGVNFINGYKFGDIIIEDGVWIGGNSTILMGTHVHKSSLVGAGSVCNKDYSTTGVLIAGSPARVIGPLSVDK